MELCSLRGQLVLPSSFYGHTTELDEERNKSSAASEKLMHCWNWSRIFFVLAMHANGGLTFADQANYCHQFKLQHEGAWSWPRHSLNLLPHQRRSFERCCSTNGRQFSSRSMNFWPSIGSTTPRHTIIPCSILKTCRCATARPNSNCPCWNPATAPA